MAVKGVETRAELREACGRSRLLRSAELVYNHILTPGMLIYIAEAVDIDRELLITAADAAEAGRSRGSMCNAIRRIIPWRMVEGALLAND